MDILFSTLNDSFLALNRQFLTNEIFLLPGGLCFCEAGHTKS